MINKRLLIKNILSNNDENTFFDRKESIDIKSNEGKAKFLKHIAALSNSNPSNNSFLIIGVDDKSIIKGTSFIDDSNIQNIVATYLGNAPIVKYENIYFPELPIDKVVGLLTIAPAREKTFFKKSIFKIDTGSEFYRRGSNSLKIDQDFYIDDSNKQLLTDLENYSKMSLKQLLDDTFDFFKIWDIAYKPQYLVFKEQFVLCWSAYECDYNGEKCLSEVDIRIVNENNRLFYSATQWVKISYTNSQFIIDEFVVLGFDKNYKLYPFERTTINFSENGNYTIHRDIIFEKPLYPKMEIYSLYQKAKKMLESFEKGDYKSFVDSEGLANYFLICYLNGIKESKLDLMRSKKILDGAAAEWHQDCMKILDKIEVKPSP